MDVNIVKAYLRGEFNQAYVYLTEELNKEKFTSGDIELLLVGSLVAFTCKKYDMSLELSSAARELCRAQKAENVFASFMIFLVTRMYWEGFIEKYSKALPIYDMELCYTTEDEIFVPRNYEFTNIDSANFSRSTHLYWLGIIDGRPEAVAKLLEMYPSLTEEEVNRGRTHKIEVMSLFNSIILERINSTDRVLDLGSGAGIFGAYLCQQDKYNDITLVDLREDALEITKKYFEEYFPKHNCKFCVGDILNSELLKSLGTFDIVIACDVVEHMYNKEFEQLLETVLDLLTPNGRFYIQTPNAFRYLGTVADSEGNIVVEVFTKGYYQHVSEKTVGYFMQVLDRYGCKYRILARGRTVIEIVSK